jgi:hypothetical protein
LPACASDPNAINANALATATIPLYMSFLRCVTAISTFPVRRGNKQCEVLSPQQLQVWAAFTNGAIIDQVLPTISPRIDGAEKAVTVPDAVF